jgi:hypothetical protein
VLSIYQKLIKVENRAVLADGTKVDHTGAAVAQVIVLAPVAVAVLRAWRTAQVEERRLWPWRKDYNDLVFTKEDGGPDQAGLVQPPVQTARPPSRPARWRQGVRLATWLGDGGATGRCASQARAGGHAAQQLLDHCRHLHARDACAQCRGGPDRCRAVREALPAHPSAHRRSGLLALALRVMKAAVRAAIGSPRSGPANPKNGT